MEISDIHIVLETTSIFPPQAIPLLPFETFSNTFWHKLYLDWKLMLPREEKKRTKIKES